MGKSRFIDIFLNDKGVFLLNAVLTVQAKLSNSHKDCGWV
jgi:uracil DNA glycosylase